MQIDVVCTLPVCNKRIKRLANMIGFDPITAFEDLI